MEITELRAYQVDFEKNRLNFKREFDSLNQLREQFVNDYPVKRILSFKLDDFIIGKGRPSFCYRIENELNAWGDIHNSTAIKFGVYYGRRGGDDRDYRFAKKFAPNLQDAFREVLKSIANLIHAPKDFKKLKANKISPMFKGKILSVYYPDDFLNIFAASHLDYFINMLGLPNYSSVELDKQQVLLAFKNDDLTMKHWTVYEFNKFLYHSFGRPNDEMKEASAPDELQDFKLSDLPPIETVEGVFVDLETMQKPETSGKSKKKKKKHKVDYIFRSKKFKRIGDRGEQIVFMKEKAFLELKGRKKLAKKVRHVSQTDDSLGYDILSYDLKGNEKKIEVKSTLRSIGNSQIFLSENELEVAQNNDNYFFYLVYNVATQSPKIWQISGEDLLEDDNVSITPTVYRLNFKTK